ncbi:MAG: hypothetical protein ACRCVX_14250 [Shewanella sp.]
MNTIFKDVIMYLLAILLCLLLVLAFGMCKKDPINTLTGKWETVSTTGFRWEYSFYQDSLCCRENKEFFDAKFCYDYTVQLDTDGFLKFTVNRQNLEHWEWTFIDEKGSLADVTVFWTQDSSITNLVLKRIE